MSDQKCANFELMSYCRFVVGWHGVHMATHAQYIDAVDCANHAVYGH